MLKHNIIEGLTTTFQKETNYADSFSTNQSMSLDFLVSTPAVLNMIIQASGKFLDDLIPMEYITVGKNIELSHEHPTLIGSTVSIIIKVVKVENNIISLEIAGYDEEGIFCKGKHDRAIIKREKLIEIAYKRTPNIS